MTCNIVAKFACNINEEYQVVNGSTFNEEYNETLDSAVILLSQIPKSKRLINIKPYQYVCVYDESGITGLNNLYLVDSYEEKENNINEHVFGYTINLMSETKWLEKIQCPNLAITHEIKNGKSTKKTIYKKIKEYMELYVPKIKYSSDGISWDYVPLISCPDENSEFARRFDVPCADTGSSAYTLRQLLTLLMQQVGCIPTVHKRVLGFLDFQKEPVPFDSGDTPDDTINFIRRNLSSDSYVNTLINMSDNVLDSENEVVAETLCFRDKSNVLLKQKENLYLETTFPIYKINKCILHAAGKNSGFISSNYGCYAPLASTQWRENDGTNYWIPQCFYSWSSVDTTNLTATWSLFIAPDASNGAYVRNVKIHFVGQHQSTNYVDYYELEVREVEDFLVKSSTASQVATYYFGFPGTQLGIEARKLEKTFTNLPSGTVGFWVEGYFEQNVPTNPKTQDFVFYKFAVADESKMINNNIRLITPYGPCYEFVGSGGGNIDACAAVTYDIRLITGTRDWDITKLIVEESARQLLDRDVVKMSNELSNPNTWTIDNLSKYVYGTVGYSIGSKRISGFSSVYNVGSATLLGWLSKDFTYIENMIAVLERNWEIASQTDLINYFAGIPLIKTNSSDYPSEIVDVLRTGTIIDEMYQFLNITDHQFVSFKEGNTYNYGNFSTYFVDLYYQPLNSFNLAYVKSDEPIDINISQYDGNSSGLTDFDRLSIHEQEQVDRIGNETLSITQRVPQDEFYKIRTFANGPLVYRYDSNRDGILDENDQDIDYIIFKRSFTMNNYYFNASYVASKGAVLKNYFTSIRTKYRAYQYIDYGQSVLRKERDTFYIRIAQDYYKGDNRIRLGNYSTIDNSKLAYWIYDLSNSSQTTKVSYECEKDIGLVYDGISGYTSALQTTKNSVSLITTNNMLGIIYECVDNAGAGTYINDLTTVEVVGGIPQSWQMWGDSYYDKHTVTYVADIDFDTPAISNDRIIDQVQYVETYLTNVQKSPIVNDFINLNTDENVIFSVVDDNENQEYVTPNYLYKNAQRTFYKDLAERINHSVQFIYYAPNNDVLFNEHFIAGAPLISRFSTSFDAICATGKFEIKDIPYNLDTSAPARESIIASKYDENHDFTLGSTHISAGPTQQGAERFYIALSYIVPEEVASLDGFKLLFERMTVNGNPINYTYSYNESLRLIMVYIWYPTLEECNAVIVRIPVRTISNLNFYQDFISLEETQDKGLPYLKVNWTYRSIYKLCHINEDGTLVDIAVFRKTDTLPFPSSSNFYFTINDTKTDYVLGEKNDILYRRYKIKKLTSDDDYDDREVVTI